ncbi:MULTISPECIES: helix-turn-helix transcriptional regulator [unclassified Rathayibacter]|uniref:helix-turn-helix transcriptional regulator n=1 Tax=unclassified Rathayibacter TaxID=2609250 RepID=UPI0006FB3D3A|nr:MULTISPECIES: helix-turn-helix transcriptional regulator [unclassified Rathayibacter]KQQ05588.1 Cro/Cl family transcriptional regulator [Rathayibacter sp. Leaf294]KQS13449.1 Cro/Cl family transcriptional regulator [Rathayibacter sp. Leaf185]
MSPAAVLAHLGSNLRSARQHAGLSQSALAERSGISRRTIVAAEAGEANISLTGVDRLALALGTTFTALVAAPGASPADIDEVAWRGEHSQSVAVMRSSVPARAEAQLWTWTLGPGDRYDAQPDPEGWHEILLVTAGVLLLERGDGDVSLAAGRHVAFSTAQPYAYANASADDSVTFTRIVVS